MLSSRTKTKLYNLSRILFSIGLLIVAVVVIVEIFIKHESMLTVLPEHIATIGAVMTGIGAIGELTFVEDAGYSNSMTEEEFYQTYCLRCSTQICKSIEGCPHRFELGGLSR